MPDAREWRTQLGHAVADEVQDWLQDLPEACRSIDPRLLAQEAREQVFGPCWSPQIERAVVRACRWWVA